jgi:hypothetical protein
VAAVAPEMQATGYRFWLALADDCD